MKCWCKHSILILYDIFMVNRDVYDELTPNQSEYESVLMKGSINPTLHLNFKHD